MLGGSKTIIGLDVGSYSVKAVALQPNKGRLTLQGYTHMRIGDNDQAIVVRQVLNQLGLKPRNLVSSVSGRSVIVRQVETPRLGENELKSHIAYEADKYIPFGTDEVVLDCQPLPGGDAEATNMQVLLVAVRRGFVEDHVTMLQSAGATPSVVDVDVFALVNAFSVLGPAGGGSQEGATALVDIGAAKSWVAIVKNDRLLFQREIYLAGNEITDAVVRTFNESADEVESVKLDPADTLEALLDAAMPALEDLANEIRLSFDYVEGQFDQEVGQVVLSGASSQLPGLCEILGNILGKAVVVFDPLSGIDLIPSKYDLHGLDANAPALTVALGLACHEIPDDLRGLGGHQVATWQPRRGGRGTSLNVPNPREAEDDQTVPGPPPQEESGSNAYAMAPPSNEAPQAYDFNPGGGEISQPSPLGSEIMTPAPPADDDLDMESLANSMPPAAEQMAPPVYELDDDDIAAPPVHDLEPEMAPPPSHDFDDPGGDYDPDDSSGRSSMLVVLEEDDEPSTGMIERGLPADDEDEDLPPLPG